MNHSILFSKTEYQILNEIALSTERLSAFELSNKLGKNYSNIHKSCKQLIENGILEFELSTNKRNAPKKFFKFTIFGFCKFLTISEWFSVYPSAEQKCEQFLNNWRDLHESIEFYSLFFLKVQNIEKAKILENKDEDSHVMDLYLDTIRYICQRIVDKISNSGVPKNWTVIDLINFHELSNVLYWETFNDLTDFISGPIIDDRMNYYLNDIMDFFRQSKGYDIIKKSIDRERMECERKLHAYNSF